MFYKTSVYITDILEQQNKFAPEDKEVYRYGIQQGLNLTLNILTTITIGILSGMVYPSILFLACYMPLRSFCGGAEFYIPKTCSSTPSETAYGDFDIFRFTVTQILNANHGSCNYKRIRIKASSNNGNTAWLSGTGFSGSNACTVLSGEYSQTIRFQAYKGTYCEIAPATLDYANYSLYYYGNDPDLAAYATIESDCA